METVELNGELHMTVPDGFRAMDEEARKKAPVLGKGDWVGFSDPDRRILMTAGWKRVNAFSAFLLNARDLARNGEKKVRAAMKPYGYQPDGFVKRSAAGNPAESFRYAYTAGGIGMRAESCSFKIGRNFYFLHFYARSALWDESLPVFDGILASLAKK